MRWIFCSILSLVAMVGTAAAAELRSGGKLLVTDGVTSIEGASGGGLATWALIGGRATDAGIGGGVHATHVRTGRFDLTSYGLKIGLLDRIEFSYARQSFDTRGTGTLLGLGKGFTFGQHVFGAKVRVAGDAVYGPAWFPQIAIGVQHKVSDEDAVVRAVGGRKTQGTDFIVSATKIVFEYGVVAGVTARLTKANQFGLLGFGGDRHRDSSVQFEGSIGKLITKRLVVGAEYRAKPNNLRFAHESDALDIFAAYAVHRNMNLTAAYVDLGSIATFDDQRGFYLSVQGAF